MGSALGKALSMTSSTSWNDLVNKIKGVANKGNLNWSGSNTTYTVSAGYYTGGTLDSRTSYNNGRTQGQNDVKKSPNSYSLYTKSQYDTNYNNGRNQGRNDVKNSPGSYGLYTKSQYDSNWSNGYNNGRKIKYKNLTLKSSSGTYGFKTYWSDTIQTSNMYYLEYNWSETHQIHSAWAYDTNKSEWLMLCANGRVFNNRGSKTAALELTHSVWNTGGYFPFPVDYGNTYYNLEIWYT